MADNGDFISNAIGYLVGRLGGKSRLRRSSMESSKNHNNGVLSAEKAALAPISTRKSSPFIWNNLCEPRQDNGDSQDALPSPRIPPPAPPVPQTKAPQDLFSTRYYMHHENRGIALIINNRDFLKDLGMPERKGTDLWAEKDSPHF